MPDYIAYYRVSTDRQGVSGLGLDAQRHTIREYLTRHEGTLLAEYTEVESGRTHGNRPELQAALAACRSRRAVLLIARLDRLARNVAFIAALMESKVDFIACDMPQATKLTIHIIAAMAEYEREMISERTKQALAAAKARGVVLGNPRLAEARARIEERRKALRPAPEIAALIYSWRREGVGLRAIARRLNELHVRTPGGSQWYASSVRNLLRQADNSAGSSRSVG